MRKKIGAWMMAFGVVAVGILLFGGFFASLEEGGWASGNAASWAQAISSVIAILAAVGIMVAQHREVKRVKQRDDARQQLRLLTSIRTEVRALYARYTAHAGKVVASAQKGQVFHHHYRFVPNQFCVFDSHVGQFGIIESDEIREMLIAGYGVFNNLVFVIEMNTDVIEALDAELLSSGGKLSDSRKEEYRARMIHLNNQIVDRNREAIGFADQILKALADEALHELILRSRE